MKLSARFFTRGSAKKTFLSDKRMDNPRKRKLDDGMHALEPLDWELKREKDMREGKRRAVNPEEREAEVRVSKRLDLSEPQAQSSVTNCVQAELMRLKQQREGRALERKAVVEARSQPKLGEAEAAFHLKEDEVCHPVVHPLTLLVSLEASSY